MLHKSTAAPFTFKMANLAQHIARLNQKRQQLPDFLGQAWTDAVTTSVSVRKEDSIERGINQDGQPGQKASYSQKLTPAYRLKAKALNAGGRKYADENALGNWYGLRQAEGLRSQVVNLTHTGEMWRAYGVLRVTLRAGVVSAEVGTTGPSAAVLRYNIERYGDFFKNTPVELANRRADVKRAFREFLTQ